MFGLGLGSSWWGGARGSRHLESSHTLGHRSHWRDLRGGRRGGIGSRGGGWPCGNRGDVGRSWRCHRGCAVGGRRTLARTAAQLRPRLLYLARPGFRCPNSLFGRHHPAGAFGSEGSRLHLRGHLGHACHVDAVGSKVPCRGRAPLRRLHRRGGFSLSLWLLGRQIRDHRRKIKALYSRGGARRLRARAGVVTVLLAVALAVEGGHRGPGHKRVARWARRLALARLGGWLYPVALRGGGLILSLPAGWRRAQRLRGHKGSLHGGLGGRGGLVVKAVVAAVRVRARESERVACRAWLGYH
mmetsp:Transcript_16385/g.31445  ORF Transcript_16385/g.31445 Transcript_16385/m.31445 type:complete len:299 (+) Transcript_16385:792-1688(+)